MENGENLLEDIAKLEDSAATQIPQNLGSYVYMERRTIL